MVKTKLSSGVAHVIPADLRNALTATQKINTLWESLTPLARNEWICWVISVKNQSTRESHIKRVVEDLMKEKRRPCCFAGCMHRKDKPLSASQKYILRKGK